MIDGLRLISSDSVDFGIKCIESDFIRNIINDIKDINVVNHDYYISLPFDSSQVLNFIQNIQKRTVDSSSESISEMLGIKEYQSLNMDLDRTQLSESNLDETQYFIKVEIESNSSFMTISEMEEDADDTEDHNIFGRIGVENEVTMVQNNTSIEDITPIHVEENADSVIQVANNDITVEVIEQNDLYEEAIPQCSYVELDDEVLSEDINDENVVMTENPSKNVDISENGSKVKVNVVASGVPLMKDIRRRKRKRGC